MKIHATVIFCLFSTFLFSQNNSLEVYSSVNRSAITKTDLYKDFILSMNYGVNYNFITDKKYNWTVGLRYANYSVKEKKELFWGSQFNGQGGTYGTKTETKFVDRFYFFEIPVGVKYTFLNKKIKLFFELSINPVVFINSKSESFHKIPGEPVIENEIKGDGYDLRKFNFFGELGVGVQWPVSKRINMQLRPSGRVQLLSSAEDANRGGRLLAIGLSFGVNYELHQIDQ